MAMLHKFFPTDEERKAELERRLIRNEAKIGGRLFGPVATGRRREFFRLDSHTWVWHEEWQDYNGQHKMVTTRYSVRPDGVIKTQDGQTYQRLSLSEARNLYKATELYRQQVGAEYQRLLQAA